jgi:hypothetical protein
MSATSIIIACTAALYVCRYAEAEKTNGRWAMMAVAGILGQELLGVTPEWWNAGAKDYGVPMAPLTAMEFLVSNTWPAAMKCRCWN